MSKYDLIKILDYASKNFEVDNGIGYWLDFEDPQNSYTSEEVVKKYYETHPLNRVCECSNEHSCIREENGYGEMIDYCMDCKAERK
jgi:hypothetical protein